METCSVVLTFESVDEILWCDHSNTTSSAILLPGTILFFNILQNEISRILFFGTLWSLRVKEGGTIMEPLNSPHLFSF